MLSQLVGAVLSLSKNQCLAPAVVVNQTRQYSSFLLLVDCVNRLAYCRRSGIAWRYRNFNWVGNQPFGQLANIIRKGGREHKVLTTPRQQTDNTLDIVNKTHIQHAIRFIQYQHFKVGKLYRALAVEIHETTGSRD